MLYSPVVLGAIFVHVAAHTMATIWTESRLFEIRDFLIEIAKEGGRIILSANPSSFDSTSKKNSKPSRTADGNSTDILTLSR